MKAIVTPRLTTNLSSIVCLTDHEIVLIAALKTIRPRVAFWKLSLKSLVRNRRSVILFIFAPIKLEGSQTFIAELVTAK